MNSEYVFGIRNSIIGILNTVFCIWNSKYVFGIPNMYLEFRIVYLEFQITYLKFVKTSQSGEFISSILYECFINTKCLCNLSFMQGSFKANIKG